MFLQTQNGKSLINADFVSQIYLEDTASGEVKLMAVTDDEILLGTYKKTEHAEMAMRFIGIALVNPDAQGKITCVPTRDDMEQAGGLPSDFKSFLESLMSGGGHPNRTIPSQITRVTSFRY